MQHTATDCSPSNHALRALLALSCLAATPAPASRTFVSEELVNAATNLVNNGIRLGNGTFCVHFKP